MECQDAVDLLGRHAAVEIRICVDTGPASEGGHGKRCLPKWNIDGNTNMAGKVEVKTIGRARFS